MVFKLKMTGANCVLLCAALFSSSLTAYATEKSADSMADSSASGVVQGKIAVSGTVKDKNGGPLIGVSVVEKGTTNGMITDLDGNFGLSVSSPEAVLEFSYVGYNPVSMKVGDRTFFAIEMGESTQNLYEVVVTALGIKREKKMLGYAVQDIKADKLNTTGDPSVIGALSGKVAGLQMNTAGTGLSGSTKITLRGNSSLTDNNQPLWVVDGVPFSDNSSRPPTDKVKAAYSTRTYSRVSAPRSTATPIPAGWVRSCSTRTTATSSTNISTPALPRPTT